MGELLSPVCTAQETDQDDMEVEIDCQEKEGDSSQLDLKRDFGTQCCFETNYIVTATVGTQTELIGNCCSLWKSTSDASVQVDQESPADYLQFVNHDHTYAAQAVNPLAPTDEKETSAPVPNTIYDSHTNEGTYSSSDDHHDSMDDGMDDDDDDYVCPAHNYQSSSDDDFGTEQEEQLHVQTPEAEDKYLVFGSCLQELLKHCPVCGGHVTDSNWTICGSLLAVKLTCLKGHDYLWNSQPIIRSTPVGNLLIASSILFTGNTFTSIKNFASCLGLKFFSEQVFYRTQDRYLFPVLNNTWESHFHVLDSYL